MCFRIAIGSADQTACPIAAIHSHKAPRPVQLSAHMEDSHLSLPLWDAALTLTFPLQCLFHYGSYTLDSKGFPCICQVFVGCLYSARTALSPGRQPVGPAYRSHPASPANMSTAVSRIRSLKSYSLVWICGYCSPFPIYIMAPGHFFK